MWVVSRRTGAVATAMASLAIVAGCTAAHAPGASRSAAFYGSPERAVSAACHPAKIRGTYTYRQDSPAARRSNVVPGRTQVGWQAVGQPVDRGWVALVEKGGSGYRVSDCKWKVNVFG